MAMTCITSPEDVDLTTVEEPIVFLAGGISGCPDWQSIVIQALLADHTLHGTILNPRRANFKMDKHVERAQITWEFRGLNACDIRLFWFPKETDCPITLFEYGKALAEEDPVVVGIEPGYRRQSDVVIQTELMAEKLGLTGFEYAPHYAEHPRPQEFYHTLDDLILALKVNIIDYHEDDLLEQREEGEL